MINLKITYKGLSEAENYFTGLPAKTPLEAQTMLDRLSTEVKGKMKEEAPFSHKRSGGAHLRDTIDIQMPDTFTRIITPLARNFVPGNKYAQYIESGTSPGRMPNVTSISQYYGVNMKMAFAIARGIQEKGTPANPFVKRTYDWLTSSVNKFLDNFVNRIIK